MAFQPGDLVVCVSTRPNPVAQPNPWTLEKLAEGAYYRVAAYCPVSLGRVYWGAKPMAGLQLVGVDHSPGHGWRAWRFRKVVAADQQFTDSLRARELEPA